MKVEEATDVVLQTSQPILLQMAYNKVKEIGTVAYEITQLFLNEMGKRGLLNDLCLEMEKSIAPFYVKKENGGIVMLFLDVSTEAVNEFGKDIAYSLARSEAYARTRGEAQIVPFKKNENAILSFVDALMTRKNLDAMNEGNDKLFDSKTIEQIKWKES